MFDAIDTKASRDISEKPVIAASERVEAHHQDKEEEDDKEEGGVRP
jgi:hypothetical protein